jgi:hypothetical protein
VQVEPLAIDGLVVTRGESEHGQQLRTLTGVGRTSRHDPRCTMGLTPLSLPVEVAPTGQ